ncbi:hypothetical protein FQR65_LT02150 [Abscondita terminalis]|nr:hypothetical protein FQR65_LT02150 [Abscondita terminalis]
MSAPQERQRICKGKIGKFRMSKNIVGGNSVSSVGIYNYQVSLQHRKTHFCGGSIISNRLILTAAHCLDKMNTNLVTISVGMVDLTDVTRKQYTVKKMIIHQNYDSTTAVNDIGILLTYKPITFNANVNKIELHLGDLEKGKVCTVTGWGLLSHNGTSPTILQELTTTVISYELCTSVPKAKFSVLDEMHICVYKKVGASVCNGDSGGPLVCDNKLAGIVSWGRKCAIGFPDIFTRVKAYQAGLTIKVNMIELYTDHLGGGKLCKATGWGALSYKGAAPVTLQEITTTSLSYERCQQMQPKVLFILWDDKQICVFKQNGTGLCSGDSGGPLAYDNKLVGLVSWGRKCANGYPDIFTRVSGYVGWIDQIKQYVADNHL